MRTILIYLRDNIIIFFTKIHKYLFELPIQINEGDRLNDLAIECIKQWDYANALIFFYVSYHHGNIESIYNLALHHDKILCDDEISLIFYFEYMCKNIKNDRYIRECHKRFIEKCDHRELNTYLEELIKKDKVVHNIIICDYLNILDITSIQFLEIVKKNIPKYMADLNEENYFKKCDKTFKLCHAIRKRLKYLYLEIYLYHDLAVLTLRYL